MADARFKPQDFGIGRLFQHIRDAVIVANARSERIVLWNDCATGLFGYSEDEALQLPLHALVPEDLRDLHRQGLARYQETGTGELVEGASRVVELRGLHKDGHEFPIELTLTKIPEQTAEGDRFALAIVRDATDRKLAEQARLAQQDAETRRHQALELNDAIVQGLAVAKYALDLKLEGRAEDVISETLEKARAIVSGLLDDAMQQGIAPSELLTGDRSTSTTKSPGSEPEDSSAS